MHNQLTALGSQAQQQKMTTRAYVSAAGAVPPDLLPELGRYFAILTAFENRLDGGTQPTGQAGQQALQTRIGHAQCLAAKNLDIKVNPQTRVVMEGTGIMGGYSGPTDKVPAELDADSPVVRIAVTAAAGIDAVQFGIAHAAGLEALDTGTLCCLRPGETADFRFTAARWGHQSVGPIASVLITGHGLLAARGGSHPGTSIPVFPSREMFSTTDTAPTAVGLVA